jgi:hypothetical protein
MLHVVLVTTIRIQQLACSAASPVLLVTITVQMKLSIVSHALKVFDDTIHMCVCVCVKFRADWL